MRGLSPEGCLARRSQLVDSVETNWVILTNPRHIFYLTNFYRQPFGLNTWGGAFLLIDPYYEQSVLIVNNWAEAAAKNAYVDEVLIWNYYDSVHPAGNVYADIVDEINLRLPVGGRKIAGERGWLPLGLGLDDFMDITPKLLEMRRRKYPDEVALIQRAIQINQKGHDVARQIIRAGMSELELFNHIQSAITLEAGQPVQLMGDFASGERAFGMGGLPTPRLLEAGDLMILDMFPVIDGYKGDLTATLAVSDELTEQQAYLENALHAALAAGEAQLKPETPASHVYHAVRSAFEDFDPIFAANFPHHAGHGLGLGHPEAPFFVPESREILQVGDVVTLEPGAYNAALGFGGRIEHNYMITQNGGVRLSHHTTSFL